MTGYALATALAAPVGALHRAVNGQLRGGRRVDGRHEALLDAELLVDRLDERREAVGRARRARDDVHGGRVVVLRVDTDDDRRRVGVLRGRRDDHLLGAALNVLHAALGRQEGAGRLAHVLDAVLLPRDLGRVAGARQRDLEAVGDERRAVLADLDVAVEAAVDRVVLKQVLEVLRGTGTVDVLDHEGLALHRDAHDLAADAAEAVDAELDRRVRVGGHAEGERVERESHC